MSPEPRGVSNSRQHPLALLEQPMAVLAFFFAAGLGLGWRFVVPALGLVAAAGAVWALMALLYCRRRSITALLCLFMVLAGMAAMSAAVPGWYRNPSGTGEYGAVRGTVTGEAAVADSSVRLTLGDVSVLDGGWQPVKGQVALTVYGTSDPAGAALLFPPGSVVEGPLTLTLPPAVQYPSGYDERLRAMTQGVRFEAFAHQAELSVTPGAVPWWRTAVGWAGERVRLAAQRWLGGERAAAVVALLTGDKAGLSDPVREGFGRLGIAHLLAVSGLHVGIVLLAVGALGKRLRWGALTVTAATAAVLAFYLLLTGPRPSMLRALLLWVVMILGRWSGRHYSPVNSLAAVFTAILLFRPLDLFDVGFQLSFMSAAGIILLYPPLDRRLVGPIRDNRKLPSPVKKALIYLVGLVLVTLCVYMATWPWMASYFGNVAPGAFLANLLFVPLATGILMISLLFALLAVIGPALSVVAAAALGPLVRLWLWLVTAASAGAPLIELPDPTAAALILSGLLVLVLSPAVLRIRARNRAVAAAVLAAALALACIPQPGSDQTTLRALGDGNNAAVLAERNRTVELLVMDRPVYYLADYCRSRGFSGPECLVFTGIDPGDLGDILGDRELMDRVERLVVPRELAADMEALAAGAGMEGRWEAASAGWEIDLSDTVCELVSFSAKSKGSKTRYAAVLTGRQGRVLYLDPQYLPGEAGWTRDLDAVVVARMTPARRDKLCFLDAPLVVFTEGGGVDLSAVSVLDGSQPVLYNMNDGGSTALP